MTPPCSRCIRCLNDKLLKGAFWCFTVKLAVTTVEAVESHYCHDVHNPARVEMSRQVMLYRIIHKAVVFYLLVPIIHKLRDFLTTTASKMGKQHGVFLDCTTNYVFLLFFFIHLKYSIFIDILRMFFIVYASVIRLHHNMHL